MGQVRAAYPLDRGAVGHIYVARAAFDEALKQFPDQRLTLRNGTMVIQEHIPKAAGP